MQPTDKAVVCAKLNNKWYRHSIANVEEVPRPHGDNGDCIYIKVGKSILEHLIDLL